MGTSTAAPTSSSGSAQTTTPSSGSGVSSNDVIGATLAQMASTPQYVSSTPPILDPAFLGATDPYNSNQMNPYSGMAATGQLGSMPGTTPAAGSGTTDISPMIQALLAQNQGQNTSTTATAPKQGATQPQITGSGLSLFI